jgi:protein TonB
MSAYTEIEARPFTFPPLREIGLWAAAGLFVLATHLAIAYVIQALRPLDPLVEASEPALMIDLAPMPLTVPETVETETVTEEVPQETLEPADDTPEPAETAELDKPVEPETVEPQQAEPEVVEPQQAEPEVVEPELTEPEIAEAVTPEVAVPLPQSRPEIKEPEKKQAERKVEPRKKVEKPAPKKEVAKAEPQTEPKAKPAARATVSSKASRAPSISPAKWQSRLSAWLNRHKRYPRGAKSRREEGVVSVSFAISASGDVLSARVSRSSGNSELDQAALDMLRRASPVPAPPPGVARKIAVPVQFNLR